MEKEENGKKNVMIQQLIYQGVYKVKDRQLYQLSTHELETVYNSVFHEKQEIKA
ncbi:Fur-regulated basic protein FbpA [Alteribacter lacisalsi]|uniref:Fur-regulated basic protein FbpA n=1 Tax=Alteribacter lacisalsi TaxID=2045244 RepID=A0A2W0HHZ8_9BACI|nr:Fur-regulated basic protein FbpA [Alteribacter lacisalsi]PYZ96419.1 Fur-regulated basic protein FbpA [Alteribacter lacisalsi]